MTAPPDDAASNAVPAALDADDGRERERPARTLEAAAVAGVVYSVLAIAGLALLSRRPDLDTTDDRITEWFGDGGHQAELIVGLNLVSISAVAFLWFVAVIRRRLGDREDRFFGTVFFGSSIAFVAVWVAGAAAVAAPAVALNLFDEASVSAGSASSSIGLGAALVLVVAPRLQAVFVISVSNLIIHSGFLPRWLAYLGFATGLVMLVMPLVSRSLGVAFPTWVFVVSVVILVTRPNAHHATFDAGSHG
jgi:hypothetical protein